MYKTILVPLDGSRRAEAILPHVEQLALHFKAKVILMQVIEPFYLTGEAVAPLSQLELDRWEKDAQAYLIARQHEFQDKGIMTQVRVSQGPVVEMISHVAEAEDADLIAIASHGRSGLSRVFYGSVAAGVLQRVDRPLLLIRSRSDT